MEVAKLEDSLVDGEPDYQIELTPEGQQLISGGQAYEFGDIEH